MASARYLCNSIMSLSELNAISPVDGRYRKQTEPLAPYFSESALIHYRIKVEVKYLGELADLPLPGVDWTLFLSRRTELEQWAGNLSETEVLRVKEIEKTTNHDVKAVEYVVKEQLEKLGLETYKEWVHFGLTSQDINNTSIPWSIKEACDNVIFPKIKVLIQLLEKLASEWKNIPMLAHTHGQPASPTKLGKEIQVYVNRLNGQMDMLQHIPYSAKFGGATGNFNAHHIAFPGIDWISFANRFVNKTLGLSRTVLTTQIEPYDHLAAFCDGLKRINTILIDLSRDVWSYISMEYFKQAIKAGEVGSSAMPHKVNPIDFENAEGNLGIANAILEHLSAKLPVSRLQRDLTDSTVLRNIGVPLSHSLIAYNSLEKGLNKLKINEEAIRHDLDSNWAVVAEAIQTILRRENYPNPYESLKQLTRTETKISEKSIVEFIDSLSVSDTLKAELRAITPFNYTGVY